MVCEQPGIHTTSTWSPDWCAHHALESEQPCLHLTVRWEAVLGASLFSIPSCNDFAHFLHAQEVRPRLRILSRTCKILPYYLPLACSCVGELEDKAEVPGHQLDFRAGSLESTREDTINRIRVI